MHILVKKYKYFCFCLYFQIGRYFPTRLYLYVDSHFEYDKIKKIKMKVTGDRMTGG